MGTAQAVERRTPRIEYQGVRRRPKDPNAAYVAAVTAAVGQCRVKAGGWRRRDLIRGRPNGVASFYALLRELRQYGARPEDVEGVLVAVYNAGRALALEGVEPVENVSLAEALQREQEAEGAENVATVETLAHPTPGNLRKLRLLFIAEMEAQRHAVDVIDRYLLQLESGV